MPRAPAQQPTPLDEALKKEQSKLLAAFGAVVRNARHDALLTVEAVADAAGVHPNYLSSIERGERNVSLFNIWRIAAALGLSVDELTMGLPRRRAKPAVPVGQSPAR